MALTDQIRTHLYYRLARKIADRMLDALKMAVEGHMAQTGCDRRTAFLAFLAGEIVVTFEVDGRSYQLVGEPGGPKGFQIAAKPLDPLSPQPAPHGKRGADSLAAPTPGAAPIKAPSWRSRRWLN